MKIKWSNHVRALLVFCLFLLIPLHAQSENKTDFRDFYPEADSILKDKNFWSKVIFKEGSRTSLAVVRMWYPYPPDKVFQIISDANRFVKIHKSYKESHTISSTAFALISKNDPKNLQELKKFIAGKTVPSYAHRIKNRQWKTYLYMNLDLPWPIENKWLIQKVSVDETQADKGVYRYSYKMTHGNMKKLEGYWELMPIPDKPGWTEFRSTYKSNPGLALPKFLAKKAAKVSLKRDFEENLQAIAKLP